MFGRLFTRMIGGIIAFAMAQLFVGLAIVVRLVPALFVGVQALFRISLILAYRLDRLILKQLVPIAEGYGLDLTRGLARVSTTTALSLTIGAGLWLLLGWHLSWLLAGVLAIHGLIVGLAWDEIEKPGGLQMGVRLE